MLPAIALVGCGGDSAPVAPTPPPTTPACVQSVIYSDSGRLPGNVLVFDSFVAPTAGRLDAAVDWTFPDTPITVSLANHAPCTLQTPPERCGILAGGSSSGPKPRRISAEISAPGTYWLYIHNRGAREESGSAQVVLSSSTCPAIATR
jgi:hypothetical protein